MRTTVTDPTLIPGPATALVKSLSAHGSQVKTRTRRLAASVAVIGFLCATQIGRGQSVIVASPAIPNYLVNVSVNPNLNKVYLSGGYSSAQPIYELNGGTLAQTTVGSGMGADVDLGNNNYWSAGVYSGAANIWSSTDTAVGSVAVGYCPGQINLDSTHRRAWVAAQCGGGNDPVFLINADTYTIVAGPIGSGGVQGQTLVNPVTGRYYISPNGVSKRVNPSTYSVTANKFGTVVGVNTVSNLLYAVTNSTKVQIINGAPDPEVILATVTMPFACGYEIGVNPALNRIYVGAAGSNVIAVLNARTGASIETISLGSSVTSVGNIVVDPTRSRVYAIAYSAGNAQLFVIEDAPLAIATVMANDPNCKHPDCLWTTDGINLLVSAVAADNSQGIFRVPASGGAATKLYSANNAYQVATVGTNLYWMDPNAGPITDTEILRARTDGSGSVSPIYIGANVGQPIVDGSGLTSDGSLLYAADEVSGSVFKLNPDGSGLTQIGPSRYGGGFSCEHQNSVAVSKGTLYLADSGQTPCGIPPAVLSIPTNGSAFGTLAAGSPLVQPFGIAAGDGRVFVTDPGANNAIWQVPAAGGTPISYYTNSGFHHLHGLAWFNGALYVADDGGTNAGAIYKIAPAQPVTITAQPVSSTTLPGGTVTLSVTATGWPLTYQWSLNGTNIAGATGPTLTLNNLSAANAGVYTVTISNPLGNVTSQPVSVGWVSMQRFAGLEITGPVGAQYAIQATASLSSPNWTTVTTITLGTQQPYIYIDYNSPTTAMQFYRAVPVVP